MSVQPTVFAGRFYPGNGQALGEAVSRSLTSKAAGQDPHAPPAQAVIVPHAGYRFCAPLIAQAMLAARGGKETPLPARIVIASPSHRHGFKGLALPSVDAFETPLGAVAVDRDLRDSLVGGEVQVLDQAFAQEHAVEVLLPYVHQVFPGVPIVPLVCGAGAHALLPDLIDRLAARPERTCFLLSSDLSHYLTQEAAQARDADTAKRIEIADLRGFSGKDACGWQPIGGWLLSRTGRGAQPVRLGMADSSLATGDTARVVGYGAWAFYPSPGAAITAADRSELLRIARASLRGRLLRGKAPEVQVSTFRSALQTHAASFVTLTQEGRLRGCVGSLSAHRPLVADVAGNAIKAGIEDKRFRPLERAEQLAALAFKIAILSRPARIRFASRDALLAKITPGKSGLILEDQGKRGTFLPLVWDSLPTAEAFLAGLVVKAGLPKGHWSDSVKVWHFTAETFSEA